MRVSYYYVPYPAPLTVHICMYSPSYRQTQSSELACFTVHNHRELEDYWRPYTMGPRRFYAECLNQFAFSGVGAFYECRQMVDQFFEV